jgi:hypothetical protein
MVKRRSVLARTKQNGKKQKIIQISLGIFIVAIMVFSVFGIMLGGNIDQENSIIEQNHTFIVVEDQGVSFWQTEIDEINVNFLYLPSQLNITVRDFNIVPLYDQELLLAFNPSQDKLDIVDFARAIFSVDIRSKGQVAIPAITEESPLYFFETLDCSNTTRSAIVFRYANETNIMQEGSCVIVQGSDQRNLLMALDRLRYTYYGFQ